MVCLNSVQHMSDTHTTSNTVMGTMAEIRKRSYRTFITVGEAVNQ